MKGLVLMTPKDCPWQEGIALAGAHGRIPETAEEVIQDPDFEGMIIPGPIRESSEFLAPSFPIIVERAAIRHGGHNAVPYVPERPRRARQAKCSAGLVSYIPPAGPDRSQTQERWARPLPKAP